MCRAEWPTEGISHFSTVLSELDSVVGRASDPKDAQSLQDVISVDDNFLLSGHPTKAPNVLVYRFSPRNFNTTTVLSKSPATFQLSNGSHVVPVPGGSILEPPNQSVGINGYWIALEKEGVTTSSAASQKKSLKTDDTDEEETCAELLSNGICLPAIWPPAANFSRVVTTPEYLVHPPSLINISRGRQLFVDSFLIANTNAVLKYYAGEYAAENPVLRPDRPWEGTTAMPFSGGVWFFNGSFHLWYNCGNWSNTPPLSNTCYATSTDDKSWQKPLFNAGTNTVRGSARKDGNTVWLDRRDPNPEGRFKIAEVHKQLWRHCVACRLWWRF